MENITTSPAVTTDVAPPSSPTEWLAKRKGVQQKVADENALFEKLYCLREARAILGWPGYKLWRAVRGGHIKAVRFGDRGHWHIPQSELVRVVKSCEKQRTRLMLKSETK
jgi:hypothetical protein